MKHATPATLDRLEPLIARLRTIEGLTEKTRGVFYLKRQAFLHFHEDPTGFFADLRQGDDFTRYRVTTAAERKRFLTAARRALQS